LEIGDLWREIIIRPMLNVLVVLYSICFNNMGIAIILFTVIVRLVTLPLTIKQLRQMRAMSNLQPRMKEIQDRYGRDRARVSQETMRLYREAGVSPVGCLGPLIIQMPILFGLFRVLIQTLFSRPDHMVALSEKFYAWIPVVPIYAVAPLQSNFLWLDLAEPDPTSIIIPLLVFVSTWVQQKLTMTPSTDPRQSTNQVMMLWLMPLMIAFFSFTLPSGLSLYWIVSNLIGIGIQYFIGGWQPIFPLFPKTEPAPVAAPGPSAQDFDSQEDGVDGRTSRNERANRRRGNRAGAERARRRPRRGRGRSTK
jgi:YidC/Oxa1 family membrane protein insertase